MKNSIALALSFSASLLACANDAQAPDSSADVAAKADGAASAKALRCEWTWSRGGRIVAATTYATAYQFPGSRCKPGDAAWGYDGVTDDRGEYVSGYSYCGTAIEGSMPAPLERDLKLTIACNVCRYPEGSREPVCAVDTKFATAWGPGSGIATCGDKITDGGESCDDGNGVAGDGCDTMCQIEPGYTCTGDYCYGFCGDGIKTLDEECDDGNQATDDGCDDTCHTEE